MRAIIILPLIAISFILLSVSDAAPPAQSSYPELDQARKNGWQLVRLIMDNLEAGDQKKYPGIQAWIGDFQKATKGIDLKVAPDMWPAFDVDALVTKNPKFWRAYYEIAPADPGLVVLHAGLLLAGGEAVRATYIVTVGRQYAGVPKEFHTAFDVIVANERKLRKKPNAIVDQGIELHDKGDFAGAIKKYEESLAMWPRNGWAYYELGYSKLLQELKAAGKELPAPGSVVINSPRRVSKDVTVAYANARLHDPFQIRAYQGEDPEVISGLLALAKRGMPVWEKMSKNPREQLDDKTLEQFAGACQEANIHDLALLARQVMVIRRGRFAPVDHPFIAASLRKLVPGEATEETLKRLAGGQLELRQLVAPAK